MTFSARAEIDPQDLEGIENPQALDWARKWSKHTTDAATAQPEHRELAARIRRVLDADDRLAHVQRRGQWLYNFWRDAEHPRGLWRRTLTEPFISGEDDWEVLIDVDALARRDERSWVFKGAQVLQPEGTRALIHLSDGGGDAAEIREFDLETKEFVTEGAFAVPAAKSSVSWVDRDRILVSTDFGAGSLTASGYPMATRLWRRGSDLAQAPVVAHGAATDVAAGAWADISRAPRWLLFERALDFYRARTWLAPIDELDRLEAGEQIAWRKLEVPDDCEAQVAGDLLFLRPRTDHAGVPAGGLGVVDVHAHLAGTAQPTVIFAPDEHTALQSLSLTENFLILTALRDVRTVVSAAALSAPTKLHELELPAQVSAQVAATSPADGDEAWLTWSSFTQPPALARFDAAATADAEPPALQVVAQAPQRFEARGVETRQHWARSADGTRIPYFIVGRFSGNQPRPTLVGGYGGFEVSLVPGYSAVRGLAWLERGNYFVQPSLRGGGEFGPAWHAEATRTNRRKVFEDHRAVLEDLVARGYARADQIVIRGGSNGGLLTAQALTQYPEHFAAAVIQVPLTDMLRYHRMSAGASWMAEYGDPGDPEERGVLHSYSPLHNVVPATRRAYPPALVTTSTRDDRVHPAHARLFARALAAAGQPVDYFENTEGGHAGAADNAQVAQVEAMIYCWIAARLAEVG
ncbi:prolyl oligopeptidase [Corynebacterium atypicum]|uniref:Prolyl oligopeptidase n=1 Tax=Corynebacterium atypicum TaxID=191610 RepID=A0ABN4DEE6_9CORY|nr:prolyl oligopeptidase family serine peptidase [Corynebacterium atypicum]AIG63569.1 prolyl oligopeptidase [Corynebacterium atypicum]